MFTTARGAALLSLLANVSLVGLKLGIGLAIGSIAVLSDALDSGMDLVGSFIALFAIRLAAQPADRSHPYGHGKFESLSAMAEGLLILMGVSFITYEAINRLMTGTDIGGVGLGIAAMSISLVVNGGISLHLRRVARETGSAALEATAWHRATDILTSLGVLVGLIIIQVTPWDFLDAVTALVVAAFVVWTAFRLFARAFRDLLDVGLPEEEIDIVRRVLEGHRGEFVEYHDMRSRRSGSFKQIDFHLVMPRNVTVGTAHELMDRIEADIEARLPRSITTIHVEPCEVPQEVCDAECAPDGTPYCHRVYHATHEGSETDPGARHDHR